MPPQLCDGNTVIHDICSSSSSSNSSVDEIGELYRLNHNIIVKLNATQ